MERGRETDPQTISLSRKVVLFIPSQKLVSSSSTNIALVCVYLHGFSIKCFASNFVLLSRVFFFSLSGYYFVYS